MTELTKLVPFSLGIVAKNKGLKTPIIEVTPHEQLTMLNGEITDNGTEYKAKGIDNNKQNYDVSVVSSNTIEAHWLPISDSNRVTSPDVRRGELVMIYQYADSGKFYWTTIKDDLRLRKLETVIYAFSGTQKETDGVSPDTHYFLEISTHKKLIHLHTSKANGEPFVYDVQLNCADGYILIQDDIGNLFTIDSKNHRIELQNTDSTHLDMDKKDFTVTVPGNTTINTTGNTSVNTSGNTEVKTTGSTKVQSGGNVDVSSGGNITITATGATAINSMGGDTTVMSTGPLHAKAPLLVLDGVEGNGGAQVQILGTVTATKIITPSQIECPSISGLAAGLTH